MSSSFLRSCHKYLALSVGVLWLLQAISGAILVFHREISDAALGARRVPTDFRRLDEELHRIAGQRGVAGIGPLTVSGGLPGFFDLYETDYRGRINVLRLDGQGNVLADMPWNYGFDRMSGLQLAYMLHTSLFAGAGGRLFLGLSGLLLLTTLLFGLRLAWPSPGQWRRNLLPPRQRRPLLKWLTWHRAIGLWLVVPALFFIATGTIEAWIEPLAAVLAVEPQPPEAPPATSSQFPVAPSQAIAVALSQHASSRFSSLEMPTMRHPWYRVRILEPGEPRRAFGTTVVYVGAMNGRVLADHDALGAPFATRMLADSYPLHTGEFFGMGGRLLSLLVGLWIVIMTVIGGNSWWIRRRRRAPEPRRGASQC